MMEVSTMPSFPERLAMEVVANDDYLAAIRGVRVPMALGLPLIRLCLIRGIRYHDGFGEELRGVPPEFTRALNARSIMSGVVPVMSSPQEFPYCIWHPQTAPEETYRILARQYPNMAYNVARACAVAGYTALYRELDVLPEVHVAEEARECGSTEIYDAIMASPVKYNVMDDYTRVVDTTAPKPGFLNGDTAPRWSLDLKQKYRPASPEDPYSCLFYDCGYDDNMFDITEDMGIDEHGKHEREYPGDDDEYVPEPPRFDVTPLLTGPLPLDLPTVEKDLLILMAAYYGNIDRYARLRRPAHIEKELSCVVRGAYHNTMFALWCARQPDLAKRHQVAEAVIARQIMNDVLAPVTPEEDRLPYLIWHPARAAPETYRELARRKPQMTPQILRACIHGGGPGYKKLFHELLTAWPEVPDAAVALDAEHCDGSGYFKEALDRRIRGLGATKERPVKHEWHLNLGSTVDSHGRPWLNKYMYMNTGLVRTEWTSLYCGLRCDASSVELLACLPEEWKVPETIWGGELDYVEWSPKGP
jgi:hypothetical protein